LEDGKMVSLHATRDYIRYNSVAYLIFIEYGIFMVGIVNIGYWWNWYWNNGFVSWC